VRHTETAEEKDNGDLNAMSGDIKPPEREEMHQLKLRLEEITSTLSEFGTDEDFQSPEFIFACDVISALSWVLGEVTTGRFCSDAYLDIEALERRVKKLGHRMPESVFKPSIPTDDVLVAAVISKADADFLDKTAATDIHHRNPQGHLVKEIIHGWIEEQRAKKKEE